MENNSVLAVSLPKGIIAEIEDRRGLISRSVFVSKLIEAGLKAQEPQKRKGSVRSEPT